MNIEQTVSAAVSGLQLGDTFTLDDLLRTVRDRRGRTLRVVELADLNTDDGVCAVWLVTDTTDFVLHARTDSALHRQQFVLHEFAHMILGHCDGEDCAVEEVLRFSSPVQVDPRCASRDIELHGEKICKDQILLCWLGAANRDADVFERPEEFDIGRRENRHLAFGFGTHFCLGSNLARLEEGDTHR